MSKKGISQTKFATLMQRDGGRCWYCGNGDELTVDHVVAGGGDHVENLRIACKPCNSRKNARDMQHMRHLSAQHRLGMPKFTVEQVEWLRRRGFDLREYDKFKFYGESTE